jgi:choline dehydrogenase
VPVADSSGLIALNEAFVAACETVGLARNEDFNAERQEGAGFYQVTVKDGRRVSAASAFLDPARKRPNLEIRTGVRVDRIHFEGTRAVGVDGVKKRGRERFDAGAVVLCAGTIASPLILHRSGVGPPEVLGRAGIAVRHDRPGVGRNMLDHCHVPVIHRCSDRLATADRFDWRSELRMVKEVLRWVLFKRGWGTITGPEAGAFVRTREDLDRPDLQFHFGASYWDAPGPLPRTDGPHFLIAPGLSRQRSTGFIEVRSADPAVPPDIQPNYLAHPDDVRALIAGVRLAKEIANAAPLSGLNAGLRLPGPGVEDDAALEDFVRGHAQTVYHATGTCRMGPGNDDVVDARLRAHGLQRLWIADASVMPILPTGNTMAPTYMVAERAAEFIRADG